MKNSEFSIEKSTMRELTKSELSQVGGGPVLSSWWCVMTGVYLFNEIVGATDPYGPGDTMFQDGFEP